MSAGPMRLLWSSRLPFVRKVMLAAQEFGVADRIVTERVVVSANKPSADVMTANPLNKIPTLVLRDGTVLYDSRVICECFDSLNHGPKRFLPTMLHAGLRCGARRSSMACRMFSSKQNEVFGGRL